jgi:demethylmenaquinone methyltransferase/2-methoxy-6-polyprenyl-1,4-benzoquinol methylase
MPIQPDAEKIKRNFGLISQGYDRANDVMTAGLLRSWRSRLVVQSGARPGMSVLDTATGTGDLALLFERCVGASGTVVGLDFCPEMLAVAQQKARRRRSSVTWMVGDVLNLPYVAQRFDIATIAYGIRNVVAPIAALQELARVVKSGGVVLVLETGSPPPGLWRTLYGAYFKTILPVIGGVISGHRGPYQFLQRSSVAFPSGTPFLDWMHQTEMFQSTEFEPFLGGVSYLYKGIVK